MEYDPVEVPGADRADRARRRRRRLRLAPARRQAAARVSLLAPRRQPLPLAGHERRSSTRRSRTWRPATRPSASRCSARSTCARTGSGSSRRSPGKVCKRKLRIYELPISYYGRTHDEGKKITWRDGFRALWVLVPRPAVSAMIGGQDGRRRRPGVQRGGADRRDARRDPELRRPDRRRRRRLAATRPAEQARGYADPQIEVVVARAERGRRRRDRDRLQAGARRADRRDRGDGRRQPDGSRRARDDRRPGAPRRGRLREGEPALHRPRLGADPAGTATSATPFSRC